MASLDGRRSTFPASLDVLPELYTISPSQKQQAARFQELKLKTQLTENEQTELSNLNASLENFMITPEWANKFGDICINLQKFFQDNSVVYLDGLKADMATYTEAKIDEVQNTLLNIEDKGVYSAEVTYLKNNIVSHQTATTNYLYICLQDCQNFRPDISPLYWRSLSIQGRKGEDGIGVVFKGQWSITATYQRDNAVRYQDVLFASMMDGNVGHTPDLVQDNIYWAKVLSSPVVTKKLKGVHTLTSDSNSVSFMVGGITVFNNATDDLEVFLNKMPLEQGLDYQINSSAKTIENLNGLWDTGDVFYFRVIRNMINELVFSDGQSIQDGTISYDKLSPYAKERIDSVDTFEQNLSQLRTEFQDYLDSSIDLSTTAQTIVPAINEVNARTVQTEYQTPTIVGSQIRLQKQSDSDRLFFKLDANIEGNVTISLDNGATSMPLRDFDNVQLISLDKGFVEVIAQATFFTYVEKGAVKVNGQDIISGVLKEDIQKFDPVYMEFIKGVYNIADGLSHTNVISGNPTGTAQDVKFSNDNVYVAVSHEVSPFITIYKRNESTFTKLPNPSSLPVGISRGCSFSPDGTHLAVVHDSTPFISIYKRNGDTFTKLANPSVLPTGGGQKVNFSSDGVYLAVAHSVSPFLTIYKRNGDTFTKLANPTTLPASTAYSVDFSVDTTYLTVGHANTPFLTTYKRSGDTFTKLADPSELPTGMSRGVSYSPDGIYLALVSSVSPYITIYKRSGDVFNKISNPSDLPTGMSLSVDFSPDGNYLAVTSGTSPYLILYERNGDTFTKIPNPSVLPTSFANGIDFSPDGLRLAVVNSFSPYITIYGSGHYPDVYNIYPSNSIMDLTGKFGAGYLKRAGLTGETREMVRIFK